MLRRCILGILSALIGLSSSTAFADDCRLYVDAGALSLRMVALLEQEVPSCEIVTSSGAATLALAIMRADEHLDADMTALPSTPVFARRVAIDEGDPEPALRRIALLAARAVESSSQIPTYELSETIEEQKEESGFGLSLSASFVTHWWSSPGRPSFAPSLSLAIDLGDFDFGLWAAIFAPHDRDVSGVEASATELGLLIRGAWVPIAFGPIGLGLDLGGGINAVWLRARPAFNVSPGRTDETRATGVEGAIRVGAVVEANLVDGRLHAFLRGGGLLRINPAEITIPEEYGADAIRTGVLGPWVELGAALHFF